MADQLAVENPVINTSEQQKSPASLEQPIEQRPGPIGPPEKSMIDAIDVLGDGHTPNPDQSFKAILDLNPPGITKMHETPSGAEPETSESSESPVIRAPEKPAVPKPAEKPKQPVGLTEVKMVQTIDSLGDGKSPDPDKNFQAILDIPTQEPIKPKVETSDVSQPDTSKEATVSVGEAGLGRTVVDKADPSVVPRDTLTKVAQRESILPAQDQQKGSVEQHLAAAMKEHNDTTPEVRQNRALDMAQHIDQYAESLVPHLVEKGRSEQQAREQLEKVKSFFTSESRPDPTNPDVKISPLERMAMIYEHLELPTDDASLQALQAVIKEHSQEIAERAFDQHLDNPEQYVSHGFDHSLNVADYTRQLMEQNPQVVDAMAKKYDISSGKAKFMLENVATCHDCGYPHVDNKAKAVHAIAGAELVSTEKMKRLYTEMVASNLSAEKRDELLHDFRDSIMYHNADTVQRTYDARITTTQGDFLVDKGNIISVISTFNRDKNQPEGVGRETTAIYVRDEEAKAAIAAVMQEAGVDTQRKTGEEVEEIAIHVLGEEETAKLKGRVLDLDQKGDQKIGLEYREVDALELPMHAAIRLTDNMDMRTNRFSEVQREPAFQEVYRTFGDGGQDSARLAGLERLRSDTKSQMREAAQNGKADAIRSQATATAREVVRLGMTETEKVAFQEQLDSLADPSQAEMVWKQVVIARVLQKPEYQQLSPELRSKIQDVGPAQNTEAMRHFGGCEAIDNLQLSGSQLTITVDSTKYSNLNGIQVTESSLDKNGNSIRANVGVGEYQIWRLKQAYSSISVGGVAIDVRVVTQDGQEIVANQEQPVL